MIYQYEAKVLEHVNNAIPEIKQSTYAKDISMFQAMSKVIKYPSMLYTRLETQWDFPAIHTYVGDYPEHYSPFEQSYMARVYVANQIDCFQIAKTLRFYWMNHAYVNVPYSEFYIKVALRLLYIKVDEERPGNDKIGPQRFVELSWKSRLFFDDTMGKDEWLNHLVEEVHIYLDNDGAHVLNNNKLIAIVK